MPTISRKFLSLLTLLTLLTFTPPSRAQTWHPDHFIVSFWCGPPMKFVTLERSRQIADAGFNLIMPICAAMTPESNQQILRTAHAAHLKAFIEDSRLPMSLDVPNARKNLDAVVADYSHFPGLAGYFLVDEPSDGSFKGLGQVLDYLREKDPAHPVFINLLPSYAPGGMIGNDYDHYVTDLITVAHSWFVSYDHYHFTVGGDAPYFFENLEAVARISKKYDQAFFNIVLATQHGPYRRLTEPEKRFEAMQTLAYGARGLLWFTYWQPDATGMWKDAIINYDGKPTYQFEQVKRVNHDLSAFGDALLHADWIHTWTTNPPPIMVKFDNLAAKLTVGFFKQGATRMLFIANQDYKNPISTRLHLATGGEPVERFNPNTQTFLSDNAATLELGPADAALYRWQWSQ